MIFTRAAKDLNAESVGQFQPRVALWQPWEEEAQLILFNPQRVALSPQLRFDS
jgi:hypothetical protein